MSTTDSNIVRRTHASIAAALSRLRVQHDFTHQHVGDRLGVTLWTSMRWCSGALIPRPGQIALLCKLYDVTPNVIFGVEAA